MTQQRFRRRPEQAVIAVQLRLDTEGLRYRKWGHDQFAKPGDWLVDNGGDVYTVDAKVFGRTYSEVSRGAYVKTAPVWAERAVTAGSMLTKEGTTAYSAGDWLVSNAVEGGDSYAISPEKFETLYELDEQ